MNQIDEHRVSFRNPTGVVITFLFCSAFWVCACAFLVIVLSACGPAVETIAPARIVCAEDGYVTFDARVDSVTLRDGVIETITLGSATAKFVAPKYVVCHAEAVAP